MLDMGGWYWFFSGEEEKLEKHRCGKWMYFFDDQTRAGEYGADFEGKIKLSEFINLDTGEFIRKEDNANG